MNKKLIITKEALKINDIYIYIYKNHIRFYNLSAKDESSFR
jgi:hypothetical protein